VTDRPAAGEPDEARDRFLRREAAGCMAGALVMSLLAAAILLLVSPEHGDLQVLVGVPLAATSVPAWGTALLLRARLTGSRGTRVAAYALLAVGAVVFAAFVASFFVMF
jgi:hypothetical protein